MSESKHGGRRPGAGRKPMDGISRRRYLNVSLPADLVETIATAAAESGRSKSLIVEDGLRMAYGGRQR